VLNAQQESVPLAPVIEPSEEAAQALLLYGCLSSFKHKRAHQYEQQTTLLRLIMPGQDLHPYPQLWHPRRSEYGQKCLHQVAEPSSGVPGGLSQQPWPSLDRTNNASLAAMPAVTIHFEQNFHHIKLLFKTF